MADLELNLTGHSILQGEATPKIDHEDGVAWHLRALTAQVPGLQTIWDRAGTVMPRVNPSHFAGMAKVICGQQLSVQSAAAIWSRFAQLDGALDPGRYLGLSEEAVRGAGFSRGKFLALRNVAEAVENGTLDFAAIDALPADEAVARLVALKGIGPWTAEVYLLFCAGHPDIFPAGDLALLKAAHHGLGLDERPSIKEMIGLAQSWAPHRSAAALLFWRYFAVTFRREGVIVAGGDDGVGRSVRRHL